MFKKRLTGLALALLAVLPGMFFVPGCSKADPDRPRLVILYAACSLSKEFLSAYDTSVPFTPAFRRFAEESLVFDKHVSEAGQSGISFASIFSGVHAFKHGAYRHPVKLPDSLYQISEAFRDAGYDPYFWSGQRMGSWELGYGQGVPRKNAYIVGPHEGERYTANGPELDVLLEKLQRDPDYEAFAQINLTLSHSPYHLYATGPVLTGFLTAYPQQMPKGVTDEDINRLVQVYSEWRLPLQWNFEETVEEIGLSEEDVVKLIAILEMLYKACMWQLDNHFGMFLRKIEEAGLLDESLIVFTADHGEILYRENALFKWTHGLQQVPEVLNVPMMIRSPYLGVEPGRYEHVTRSIDVYPTMTGLCGIELPKDSGVDGTDLSRVVLGQAEPPNLLAYSHTTTLGPNLLELFKDWTKAISLNPREDPALNWVRVREGDMAYKWRNLGNEEWGFEVFDLSVDRGETNNLYDPNNPKHQEMTEKLRGYKQIHVDSYGRTSRVGAQGGPSEEDELQRMKDLGYVGGDDE